MKAWYGMPEARHHSSTSCWSFLVEGFLDFIERFALCLDHIKEADDGCKRCASTKQEVCARYALIQQDWADECHEEIADPIEYCQALAIVCKGILADSPVVRRHTVCQIRSLCPSMSRLDLGSPHLDADSPSRSLDHAIDVDCDNDDPACRTTV